MGYQIAVNNDVADAAVHDSARDTLTEYQSLRESHGDAVTVLRDNVQLDPAQLIADADIEAVIEDWCAVGLISPRRDRQSLGLATH